MASLRPIGTAYSCVGIFMQCEMEIINESDDEKQMTFNSADFVPAKDFQRQATKGDHNIAGFNILRIINEPTAVDITYELDKEVKAQKGRRVLIFDLGGGIFVMSVLTVEDDTFEVTKSTAGENVCSQSVSHFLIESKEKHKNIDIATNAMAVHCLRTACECAKRFPSRLTRASLQINNLFKGIGLDDIRKKGRFEDMNTELFRQTMALVKKVLRNAEMGESQIHDFALVNRANSNPGLPLLQHFFNTKLNISIDPDEAIAYGAAIQFAILSSDYFKRSFYFKDIYSTVLRKRWRILSNDKPDAAQYLMSSYQSLLSRKTASDVQSSFSDLTDLSYEEELFKTYSTMLVEYRKIQNQSETVLNTDVLIKIFSYVPMSQWPELARVSKQFQQTVKRLYTNLKSLNFCPSNSKLISKQQAIDAVFTKSLTGFDKIIGVVSFEHFDKLRELKHLSVVGFESCRFKVDEFSQFLTYSPQLQELSIRYCTLESKHLAAPEDCLRSFQKISGLNVLVLNGFDTKAFTGKFLSFVKAERIERLDFFNSNFKAS